MPRFAILTHDFPFLHWDLLLENEAALRTWRLIKAPDTAGEIPAEELPEHRKTYLDYEGPVSGNRGSVQRWDVGEFERVQDSPDHVVVVLAGSRLAGTYRLRRTGEAHGWVFSGGAQAPR